MSDNNKLRRGRPPKKKDNVKSERVTFRLTKSEIKKLDYLVNYYRVKNPNMLINNSVVLNRLIHLNFKAIKNIDIDDI